MFRQTKINPYPRFGGRILPEPHKGVITRDPIPDHMTTVNNERIRELDVMHREIMNDIEETMQQLEYLEEVRRARPNDLEAHATVIEFVELLRDEIAERDRIRDLHDSIVPDE